MVRKKNNEIRLCVDYRALNAITVKENYPVPLIDDHLDLLKHKKYFTSLDLKNGFHHIKMAEDSIKYTSFVTPLGQFEYLRCPFGLTNAPRVFQRFVNSIFHSLIREHKILLYLDDLLIATDTLCEHFQILSCVFDLAAKYGLVFRLDKCEFLSYKIVYLGYCVSEFGITPNPASVECIINYPTPKNVHDVHKFIGFASYFRRFIPNFSVIAKPLYALVKKNAQFQFSFSEEQAFNDLKSKLASCPLLAIYSPELETELHCDASSLGYGAILMQKQSTGKFQPVSYFSKRTTPLKQNIIVLS